MRSDKDLKDIIAATLAVSKGTCVFNIVATSKEEAARFVALLKGKHGAGVIGVRVEEPEGY